MIDETPPGTRELILRAALDLFAAQGFHATSVREIAERVGVTKAAVLYHFPGKADILAELAEPMLRDLEAAVAAAEAAPPEQARRRTLEGLLDALIAHRHLRHPRAPLAPGRGAGLGYAGGDPGRSGRPARLPGLGQDRGCLRGGA